MVSHRSLEKFGKPGILVNLNEIHNTMALDLRVTYNDFFRLHEDLMRKAQANPEGQKHQLQFAILSRLLEHLSTDSKLIEHIKFRKSRNILHQGNTRDCIYHALINALDLLESEIGRGQSDLMHISTKENLIKEAKKIHDYLAKQWANMNMDAEEIAIESAKAFLAKYVPKYDFRIGISPIEFLRGLFFEGAVGILNIKEPSDYNYTKHSVVIHLINRGVIPKVELEAIDSLSTKNQRNVGNSLIVDPYLISLEEFFKPGNSYHLIVPKS